MSELEETLTPDHIKLVDNINRRVDSIFQQLCEYEDAIDPRTMEDYGDAQTKIMDLLETLETIQDSAQRIRPFNLELRSQQKALDEQMKCLELSLNLMKLETGKESAASKMLK